MTQTIEVCEDCPYNSHPCPEGCSKIVNKATMTLEQKKAIEEASLKLGYANPMLSFQHGAEFGFHLRDEEVERLKKINDALMAEKESWPKERDEVLEMADGTIKSHLQTIDTLKKQVERQKELIDKYLT